ncbi:hypothetical protein [Rufibacter immobilis]|uniref:hypothetical protein n=1 Tax=Rufibacter immobilis TaxID=1348778 RepID=UPI0035EF087F
MLFHDFKLDELTFTGDQLRLYMPADHTGREVYEVKEGEYLRIENDFTITHVLGVNREYYRFLKRLDEVDEKAISHVTQE